MSKLFFISQNKRSSGPRNAPTNALQGGLASLKARRSGQVMLLSVILIGGILLSAGAIGGLLLIFQVRQANDSENSAKAFFAADAGIEVGSYQYTKVGPFGDVPVPPFTNGATASSTLVYDQIAQIIAVRSQGASQKAVRALEAIFDIGNQGGIGPCVSQSGIFAVPAFAESVPQGGIQWDNPLLALASDDARAASVLGSGGLPSTDFSDELRVSQFNFCIPSNATVTGIEVQIEKREQSLNRIRDREVFLLDDQGNPIGANRADLSFWPLGDTIVTYGGATDVWGTSLTSSQINDQNFGIMLVAEDVPANSASNSAEVDAVSMAVYFTSLPGL